MYFIEAGGWGFILAVVLGVIGAGLSLGGVVVAFLSKNWAIPLAASVVLLLNGMCAGCTGVLSYGNTMSKVNRALEYPGFDPQMRYALEREGTMEAQIPLVAGIGASILPFIAGIACGAIAMRRRSMPKEIV